MPEEATTGPLNHARASPAIAKHRLDRRQTPGTTDGDKHAWRHLRAQSKLCILGHLNHPIQNAFALSSRRCCSVSHEPDANLKWATRKSFIGPNIRRIIIKRGSGLDKRKLVQSVLMLSVSKKKKNKRQHQWKRVPHRPAPQFPPQHELRRNQQCSHPQALWRQWPRY